MNEETRALVRETLRNAIVEGLEVEIVCSILEELCRDIKLIDTNTISEACWRARREWDI